METFVKAVIQLEKITTAQAKKWLTLMRDHHMNRPRNQDKVLALWLEMEEGRWDPQLSIIRLAHNSKTGAEYPIDGQHRLEAIVEYDQPVQSLVQRGLDPASFMLMDQGWNRSPQQQLGLVLNVKPATAKVIVTAAKPMLLADGHNVKQMTVAAQASAIVASYPRLIELAKTYGREMTGVHNKTGVQASTVLRWLYRHAKQPPGTLTTALNRLRLHGERVDAFEPFDWARQRLTDEVERVRGTNANRKDTRDLPVQRQLAILDFALKCVQSDKRIVTQRGFDQECTTYLKSKKL